VESIQWFCLVKEGFIQKISKDNYGLLKLIDNIKDVDKPKYRVEKIPKGISLHIGDKI